MVGYLRSQQMNPNDIKHYKLSIRYNQEIEPMRFLWLKMKTPLKWWWLQEHLFHYHPTNSIKFCPLEDLQRIDFLSPPNRNIKDLLHSHFFLFWKEPPKSGHAPVISVGRSVWNLINYNFHGPSPNWHTIDPWNKSPSTEKLINSNAKSRSLILKVSWWVNWKLLFHGDLIYRDTRRAIWSTWPRS